ncbi:A/G-specific adenine glycosylase [Sphingomonas sp.]|uniref:A/G-specific adenine glycosylase n=1 Tax=Sphingomonas sp. TaxID=28214 RepID=UPI00286B6F47|nr:A/G-specific adenine glycosylase [Sphingomonas sp.]
MLQQTTVAAVTPRFEQFVARWPTIDALAEASDEAILAEWAGLGYYARARNLIACARQVAAKGGFPTTERELRTLPGIGDYTAAAIAAIAFGHDAAPIDTNVTRVMARLYGLKQPSANAIRALVEAIVPPGQAGNFAQAMMDLGATICRTRAPDCPACPWRGDCAAFASGMPETYPEPKAKRVRPQRHGIAYWIERDGAVWLVRRPANGLLGGMAALPGTAWTGRPQQLTRQPLTQVRHVFTHFALDLAVVAAVEMAGDGWWHPVEQLDQAGLPTLYRRAAEQVLARAGERSTAIASLPTRLLEEAPTPA